MARILAAALLSISLNPFVFAFMDRIGARPPAEPPTGIKEPNPATANASTTLARSSPAVPAAKA